MDKKMIYAVVGGALAIALGNILYQKWVTAQNTTA